MLGITVVWLIKEYNKLNANKQTKWVVYKIAWEVFVLIYIEFNNWVRISFPRLKEKWLVFFFSFLISFMMKDNLYLLDNNINYILEFHLKI